MMLIVDGVGSTVISSPGKVVGGSVMVKISGVGSLISSLVMGMLKHERFWFISNDTSRALAAGTS